ncbi:hypothetical protein PUNSTDRAFT_105121 [Punctularia strigosozonata HHB-11173 SS5]|uniref:uncharacterized protein n=1 Tax=Punctularia strigosozonata (strain HHB-11173) TaxID=741275 RepID=UPI0004416F56|nr:uncharacterized protein PUNSTDRAFT_105121 [Punctularia strigosozonata HHB-11173 SS5]EIN07410.1 hypothetical protein PUNSTDRAFT_105121 [Punctularia strigosozonata HHB-11173 SS5]
MAGSAPPQLVFSNDVAHMAEWANRTRIPLTSADALGTTYARARKWFLTLKTQLIQNHGFREITPADPRMLISLECPSPYRSAGGLPRTPNFRLQIPVNASSFFSPERQLQWQMVFHGALFPAMRHNVRAIQDLVNMIQCLLTGVLTLVKEDSDPREGFTRTVRALPPPEWIQSHQADLVEIFGPAHYTKLFRAAADPTIAFKLERPDHDDRLRR